MADEEWDTDQSLSITHEVDNSGEYTMTVSDRATGSLQFAWRMDVEYAEEVARGITEAVMAYKAAMN